MSIETANYLLELVEFLRSHGFTLAADELADIVAHEMTGSETTLGGSFV